MAVHAPARALSILGALALSLVACGPNSEEERSLLQSVHPGASAAAQLHSASPGVPASGTAQLCSSLFAFDRAISTIVEGLEAGDDARLREGHAAAVEGWALVERDLAVLGEPAATTLSQAWRDLELAVAEQLGITSADPASASAQAAGSIAPRDLDAELEAYAVARRDATQDIVCQ